MNQLTFRGVVAVPQRYTGQPAIAVTAPFAAELDPGCQFLKRDAGAVFLDGLVRGGLADEDEVRARIEHCLTGRLARAQVNRPDTPA